MVNGAGVSPATQPVSGAVGRARKDARTLCAQGDWGTTKWPIPGIRTAVERGSVRPVYGPHFAPVLASKVPETMSVGTLLKVATRWIAVRSGTFQTRHRSCSKGSCGAWARTVSGHPGKARRPAARRSDFEWPGTHSLHATECVRPWAISPMTGVAPAACTFARRSGLPRASSSSAAGTSAAGMARPLVTRMFTRVPPSRTTFTGFPPPGGSTVSVRGLASRRRTCSVSVRGRSG